MRLARLLFVGLMVAVSAILGATAAVAQTWSVQSADYGAGNQRQDVTNVVRRLVNGPNFKVNNANLGTDPAIGRDKTCASWGKDSRGNVFVIFLTAKGKDGELPQMFSGGGPGFGGPGFPGWGGGGGPGGGGNNYGLRITSAMWGLGSRQQDVTNRLQNMVRNNRLSVDVTPRTMGGDPVVGANKVLTVYYNWNGRNQSKVAPENTVLNLP